MITDLIVSLTFGSLAYSELYYVTSSCVLYLQLYLCSVGLSALDHL